MLLSWVEGRTETVQEHSRTVYPMSASSTTRSRALSKFFSRKIAMTFACLIFSTLASILAKAESCTVCWCLLRRRFTNRAMTANAITPVTTLNALSANSLKSDISPSWVYISCATK